VSQDEVDTASLVERVTDHLFGVYRERETTVIKNMVMSSRFEVEEKFALQKAEAEKEGRDLGRLVVDEEKLEEAKTEEWRDYERVRYLQTIDVLWKEHLQELTRLKEGIHLHAYAQKDPKLIYKQESYDLFLRFWEMVDEKLVETVYQQEVQNSDDIKRHIESRRKALEKKLKEMKSVHPSSESAASGGGGSGERTKPETYRRERPKIGRNDPCYCGSGKKYKKCHLMSDLDGGNAGASAQAVGE